MDYLEKSVEIRSIVFQGHRNKEISNLLCRNYDQPNLLGNRQSLRYKKKNAAQQRKKQKQDYVSFLAKTYLDCSLLGKLQQSQKKFGKKDFAGRTTPLNRKSYSKIDVQKFNMHVENTLERQTPRDNPIHQPLIKRTIRSAVSRTYFDRVSIEVTPKPCETNKEFYQRKSSFSRKVPRQPISGTRVLNRSSPRDVAHRHKSYCCSPDHKVLISILSSQGWSNCRPQQNPVLKWAYQDNHHHYSQVNNLQIRCYNHIKDNPLVTVQGRLKIFKGLSEENMKPHLFMPREYTHKEEPDYVRDFQLTSVLILLDKHLEYCRQKQPMFQDIYRLYLIKKRRGIQEEGLDGFLERKGHLESARDPNYLVHTSMCIAMFRVLDEQRYRRLDAVRPKHISSKILIRNLKMLVRFSRMAPTYQQFAKNQFSGLDLQFNPNVPVLERESKWQTPSRELVLRLVFYMDYFQSVYPQGWDNIWTIKTKGEKDRFTSKLTNVQKHTVMSKYVQDSKYKMNQLVLIRSVEPLMVYVYEKASWIVLSNNEERLVSEKEFQAYMNFADGGKDFKMLKGQVFQIIAKITRVASGMMTHIDGCFEILTFTIALDGGLNPWVTNIIRESYLHTQSYPMWMRDMVTNAMQSALRLVIPKQLQGIKCMGPRSPWILLIRQKEVCPDITWLEVFGKGITPQTNTQKKTVDVQGVVKIQRAIREFLRAH